MSRTLTNDSFHAMFAAETDEVYLMLITISHPQLTDDIRVSSDIVNTTSQGKLFVGYPFEFVLPTDEEGAPPRSMVTIDNVDREICNSLRQINSPANFKIEIIRAADPDTIEISWDDFQLRNVKGDVFQISGELNIDDITREPFPVGSFTPSNFRGLFA